MKEHYDARTGQTTPWPDKRSAAGRSFGICRQESYLSCDGTIIRMFIVSATGRPDRPRPTLLTGYGGFGVSVLPAYLPHALAWVRSGGIYAVASLRGGGEEGEEWHRSGMAENKQNVFDDLAAAADHLVDAGWTTRAQRGLMGESNGGLLVGAALTQHPEMYAAVVCINPLLDMARYEIFGLGPTWRVEYGSMSDPRQRLALMSYSPYHHVVPGRRYPPTLLMVAEADTRVDPLHARKMCAQLQHSSAAEGMILLRTDRGVGHGARAASKEIALVADALAFLGHNLGLDPSPVS